MPGKLTTLEAAAALVPSGASLSVGGFTSQRHPTALLRALVRRGVRDLIVYCHSAGSDIDLLIGAGCVRRVEGAYLADGVFAPVAPNWRRFVEAGRIEFEDYSNAAMTARFAAGAMGLPCLPTRSMLGTDLLIRWGVPVEARRSDPTLAPMKVATMQCPFSGLPLLGAMLARRRHAPSATIVFEAGAVDPEMLHLPMSVGDSRTLVRAAQAAWLFEVLAYVLQGGRVDVGFLGAGQIDRYGNLNSTAIGDYHRPRVRFPGSGGSADVAAHSGRTVIMARHERRRFPERVDYLTSPGWLSGGASRRQAGLGDNGPAAVVTTMGVIRYRPDTREPYLAACHPCCTPEEVQAETGFHLDISGAVETPVPTAEDLDLLRRVVDPEGIFLDPPPRRVRDR